jgi:hypothetical protein
VPVIAVDCGRSGFIGRLVHPYIAVIATNTTTRVKENALSDTKLIFLPQSQPGWRLSMARSLSLTFSIHATFTAGGFACTGLITRLAKISGKCIGH